MAKTQAQATVSVPNDLEPFWMPFTANRSFKKRPRLIARAKDMHYYTPEGRAVLDAAAGLWCTNAGHNREPIVAAIQAQAAELDFSPTFQFGHPKAFELAARVAALAPGDLDHVFFCNSGSEATDTALKIALAYWNVRGEGAAYPPDRPRARLSRRRFRRHLGRRHGQQPQTLRIAARRRRSSAARPTTATSRPSPKASRSGAPQRADALEDIVALHDASTIAAVIVEPMAGSTGVLPAPKGYLQRLRAICDKHGILLIFDEVITGFGRLGAAFAAERYGVIPDMICFAKGITSGSVPMGGVHCAQGHLRRLHEGARARRRTVPRLHLFGASAGLRGGPRHARSLSR